MSDRHLREARMQLAQAVTRSLDADATSDPSARAAADHRAAAIGRLRAAGRATLAQRLDRDAVTDAAARAELREVMQLIDAELELGDTLRADGGRQATERRACVDCGGVMRVPPSAELDRCVPCRGESDD